MKSAFLSAFGIVFQIWKALTEEVKNQGGGDDDLRRIETNLELRRKLAELIVDNKDCFQFTDERCVIQVPALPRLTLEELKARYSWIERIERDDSPVCPVTLRLATVLKSGEDSINGATYERRLVPRRSMLLGLQTVDRSGQLVQPDFCYQIHACDPLGKASQFLSEYYNIPYFVLDIPPIVNETTRKYLLTQMLDAIEWMEKVSGKRYDDKKLIEAVYNETDSMILWARVCQLNQAIPAPVDLRHLASLVMPLWTSKHKRETVEYLQVLFDEVQERVKKQISARGFERLRLIHWGQWPWYFPRLLRVPEKYGALFIGSNASFGVYAAYSVTDDGSWVVADSLREQGIVLKTREEALNVLIDFYVNNPTIQSLFPFSANTKSQVKLMEQWHTQAAVFNLSYDCKGMTSGQLEARLAIQKRGFPTLLYEVSSCDPRDFDEVQVTDRLDSFLESLGLSKES